MASCFETLYYGCPFALFIILILFLIELRGSMKRRITEENLSKGHCDKKFITENKEIKCSNSQKNNDDLGDNNVPGQINDCKIQNDDQLTCENNELLIEETHVKVLQPLSSSQGNEKMSDASEKEQAVSNDESSVIKSSDTLRISKSISSVQASGGSTKELEVDVKANSCNNSLEIVGPCSDKKEIPVCCPGVHFIIMEGEEENMLSSLKNDPPKLILELDKFLKAFKSSVPLKVYCLNCKTGEMNDWNQVSLHLVGKNHRSKVRNNKNVHSSLFFCSSFTKICFYHLVDKDQILKTETLPEDLQPLIKKIFPNAKARVNKNDLRAKINIRKKNAQGVDAIFEDLSVTSCFEKMFDAVDNFGHKHGIALQSLVFFQKDINPPWSCAFAYYIRNINHGYMASIYETFINGCPFKIRIVPNFDAEMQGLLKENIDDPSFHHTEWNVGSLTPACSIFKNWIELDKCVNLRLQAMDKASNSFFYFTQQITNDIWLSLPGVKSIDYFGSQVTGLALPDSDFDLQISIGGTWTVKNIANKYFYRNPWFHVKQVVGKARVPVIKLWHKKTRKMCDVSLNNFRGVINSQLLRFYLQMDWRVKWLVALVKMWASKNHLCGIHEFTSYSQVWLVLFFLMQKDISLVPCVKLLTTIKSTSMRTSLISEDTGTCFTLDMVELKKIHDPALKCKMTKDQLITNFFKFCVEVLPLRNALVPFTGEMLTRDELRDFIKTLPSNYIEGNLHTDINKYSLIIVDPIIQSFNISASVSKRLDYIIQLATQTLELMTQSLGR